MSNQMRVKAYSNFYEQGLGDRLVDSSHFPASIECFLAGERNLLHSYADQFDLLIEVGCMDGRYLTWAAHSGKLYLGIDVVPRYIDIALKKLMQMSIDPKNYRLVVGDVVDLPHLISKENFEVSPPKILTFFPFNSFGNILDIDGAALALSRMGTPTIISTYGTHTEATIERKKYYANCHYDNLQLIEDERGVYFKSNDGLCSVAYHFGYIRNFFSSYGITASSLSFSKIGEMIFLNNA
ncbi:MAG TPA: hypothetical protein DEG92_04805 [Rikenellaceae bacterium]|nr:hypothetical protein [Rikenellaceae bacterium]